GRLLVVGPANDVREEILRLAATAGIQARAIEAAELTNAIWSGASLVVVDADSADQVCSAALTRRPGLVIVTTSRPSADVWSAAVSIGVEQVLELPAGQAWLVDRLTDAAGRTGPLGVLVAVIGGCGGAGASTLAAALATSAARSGHRPVLLGTDPWDGGIDIALGAEDVSGPRWPDLAAVSGRLSTAAILDGLPQAHGVRFLSSARSHAARIPLPALAAVVTAARRTGGPVIVDLPRDDGEAPRWLGGIIDLGLVVCSATVSGALATRALVAGLGWQAPACGVAVRVGLGLDIDDHVLSSTVGLPVLVRLREDTRLTRQRKRGEPPAPRRRSHLAKSCAQLWQLATDRRDAAG
ncbi:MAG: septum formation initiator, partial [Actinomycetota bacterium]|nr:septum formation initiator [Actinomycetota bacterium]